MVSVPSRRRRSCAVAVLIVLSFTTEKISVAFAEPPAGGGKSEQKPEVLPPPAEEPEVPPPSQKKPEVLPPPAEEPEVLPPPKKKPEVLPPPEEEPEVLPPPAEEPEVLPPPKKKPEVLPPPEEEPDGQGKDKKEDKQKDKDKEKEKDKSKEKDKDKDKSKDKDKEKEKEKEKEKGKDKDKDKKDKDKKQQPPPPIWPDAVPPPGYDGDGGGGGIGDGDGPDSRELQKADKKKWPTMQYLVLGKNAAAKCQLTLLKPGDDKQTAGEDDQESYSGLLGNDLVAAKAEKEKEGEGKGKDGGGGGLACVALTAAHCLRTFVEKKGDGYVARIKSPQLGDKPVEAVVTVSPDWDKIMTTPGHDSHAKYDEAVMTLPASACQNAEKEGAPRLKMCQETHEGATVLVPSHMSDKTGKGKVTRMNDDTFTASPGSVTQGDSGGSAVVLRDTGASGEADWDCVHGPLSTADTPAPGQMSSIANYSGGRESLRLINEAVAKAFKNGGHRVSASLADDEQETPIGESLSSSQTVRGDAISGEELESPVYVSPGGHTR
jgi:hypothetical protein